MWHSWLTRGTSGSSGWSQWVFTVCFWPPVAPKSSKFRSSLLLCVFLWPGNKHLPLAFFNRLLCARHRAVMAKVNNKQCTIYNAAFWNLRDNRSTASILGRDNVLGEVKRKWSERQCLVDINLLPENIPGTSPLLSSTPPLLRLQTVVTFKVESFLLCL